MSQFDYLSEESDVMKERQKAGTMAFDKEQFFNKPISEFKLSPVKVVSSTATLDVAVSLMQSHKIGSVVITEKNQVVGILTERDIVMKVTGKKHEYHEIKIADVMTRNPVCLQKKDSILYVMNNMHLGNFRHIPIVNENNEPLFMISVRDVLSYFFNTFSKEIESTSSEPYRGPKNLEEGG